jgi:hypothetical protein
MSNKKKDDYSFLLKDKFSFLEKKGTWFILSFHTFEKEKKLVSSHRNFFSSANKC